jgi:hypothetical protein
MSLPFDAVALGPRLLALEHDVGVLPLIFPARLDTMIVHRPPPVVSPAPVNVHDAVQSCV